MKERQYQLNNWFAEECVDKSISTITEILASYYLKDCLSDLPRVAHPLTIGIVPDGLTPMSAGLDLLAVMLAGHRAMVRQAPHDTLLLPALLQALLPQCPWLPEVCFEERLSACNAIIVNEAETSSDAMRTYMARRPHLLRPPQCTVAILTGQESKGELSLLACEMTSYFGRARQSVRMIYVPENYDFLPLLEAIGSQSVFLQQHHQWLNHIEYQKSIRLMNNQFYMDAGTFLLVEHAQSLPPVGVIYYTFYKNNDSLKPAVEQEGFSVYNCEYQENICERYMDKTFDFLKNLPQI